MSEIMNLVGLAGFPFIRSLVATTGTRNGFVKVLLSLVFGIMFNVACSYAFSTDLKVAVALGIITGLLSNVYNDIKDIGKPFRV